MEFLDSSKRFLSHDDTSDDDLPSPPAAKRRTLNPSSPLQTCTIHRVHCSQEKHHSEHPAIAYFEDHPRLFEGDCKASALRGQSAIHDISEYLESRSHLKFVFYKIYSCDAYHSAVEDIFRPLERPKNPFLKSLLPFFYHLDYDGEPARSNDKAILVSSSELISDINLLTRLDMVVLQHLDEPKNTHLLATQLYHHRQLKNTGSSTSAGMKIFSNLDLVCDLIDVVEDLFGDEYDEADALFAEGNVTMSHLSKLFVAGDILVSWQEDEPLAYKLEDYQSWPLNPYSSLANCWAWSFDGRFWKSPTAFDIKFPSGQGRTAITDLPVYPLRYAASGVQERLLSRGRQFWSLRVGNYVSCQSSSVRKDSHLMNQRYMIDMITYHELHRSEKSVVVKDYLEDEAMEAKMPPGEEFLLLLPATIQGFRFQDKKWHLLNVSQIGPINWNKEAFDHLVLQSTKKQLIKALVKKHDSTNEPMDVIEGKGNGLILLLHGGPGTGKTLTAESVAELTHRPLYRVTCGDVGTNAEEVEAYLESALYLGKLWRCVVLLDEADVFLEERTRQDLKRNALVSVFLRVIEYYDGILILTSNRIGTFDEAFKSRVQLIVHYPNLQIEERRRIWFNFINSLQNTSVKAHISELQESIPELSEYELNGREIRNVVQTATLLAQFKGRRLALEHLKDVIAVSDEFKQYLRDKYGDDEEYAQSSRVR